MATQTQQIGMTTDPNGGQATLTMAYDDVPNEDGTLNLISFTIDNQSSQQAFASATRVGESSAAYTLTVDPADNETQNIDPENNPIYLTQIRPGRLSGVDWTWMLL